jgi:hypothetical protein
VCFLTNSRGSVEKVEDVKGEDLKEVIAKDLKRIKIWKRVP